MAAPSLRSPWYGGPPAALLLARPSVQQGSILLRGSFYLFVASLPFEMPQRSIPLEIPTLTGAIFLLAAVMEPRRAMAAIPWALVCFTACLLAIAVSVATMPMQSFGSFAKFMALLVQSLLVFWVATNLMRDERVALTALLWFVGACAVGAALPLVGIGRTTYSVWTGGERVVAFGQNANQRANVLASGFVVLIGLAYGGLRRGWRLRALSWLLLAVIATGVVQTGSRVGLVILGAGSVVLALGGSSIRVRLRSFAVVVIAVAGLSWMILNTEVMRERLKGAQGLETYSGRERIFPALGAMFVERPLTGWGPVNNQYEVARRINERKLPFRDTHNLVLELLTSTGVLGTVPFLLGLWLCVNAAWRARTSTHGVLPLALVMAALVANMSGNHIGAKLFWFVLAYGTASALWRRPEPAR
jgi:O-antigen ligase